MKAYRGVPNPISEVVIDGHGYSKRDLTHLFIDQGLGIAKAGERLGLSWFQMNRLLKKSGIEVSWKREITPRAYRIYRFVNYYIRRNHQSPLLKEIAEGTGLKTCSVLYHLKRLREAGLVDWDRRKRRTIRIIKKIKVRSFGFKLEA